MVAIPGEQSAAETLTINAGRQDWDGSLRNQSVSILYAVKIYTKTGDAGETSLFDGTRVAKSDPRVVAYGEVDELQAVLGVAQAGGVDAELQQMIVTLQRD